MNKVAVVILNFNGESFLRQFLPAVIQHSQNADIVVADNASTDNSLQLLHQEFQEVKVIELKQNYGYAGGYNQALKQVEAPYYLLLNSDVEVTSGWLDPLVDFLENNTEYAACQPKLLDFHRKEYFEYAGAAGGFIDKLGYPYCQGRIFDHLEKDQGQYDQITDVQWCSGAAFLIRSSVFHEAGGFDADFFAHMEEIDLCWRLGRKGHKLAFVPTSKVYHVGGGTLSHTSPNKTYLNFRNNLNMLVKNLSFGQLLSRIPIRVLLDYIAGLKFAIDQSPAHLLAVFRAHKDFVISIGKTWKKRTRTLKKVHLGKSILIQFYLKGRKTYTQLNNTK